jgi:type IV pilus assembly protein PilA
MPMKLRNKDESGFTLIELMIVIAIIGILAAIAIPQFSSYRLRSFNSASNEDLRNAQTAQETYFVDARSYANNLSLLTGSRYGLFVSDRVTVTITSATSSGYIMSSYHSSGDKTWSISGPGGYMTGK